MTLPPASPHRDLTVASSSEEGAATRQISGWGRWWPGWVRSAADLPPEGGRSRGRCWLHRRWWEWRRRRLVTGRRAGCGTATCSAGRRRPADAPALGGDADASSLLAVEKQGRAPSSDTGGGTFLLPPHERCGDWGGLWRRHSFRRATVAWRCGGGG